MTYGLGGGERRRRTGARETIDGDRCRGGARGRDRVRGRVRDLVLARVRDLVLARVCVRERDRSFVADGGLATIGSRG